MPDRIPELDRLAAEAKEVPMLPASEIRRRGNRRRTTRQVAVGGIVTALALVAGLGIWQSPMLEQARNPQWANTAIPETPTPTGDTTVVESPTPEPTPEPTETPTAQESEPIEAPVETETPGEPSADPTETGTAEEPPAAPTVDPPTWDNVPTPGMLFHEAAPGEVKNEYEGLGQAAKGLCDPGVYGNPSTILTREMGAEGDYPAYLDAIVLGYGTPEAASNGFDLIRDAALGCEGAMEQRAGLEEPGVHDATNEVGWTPSTDADPVRMSYVTYAGLIPDTEYGMFGETLVLQAGERLVWVTGAFEGMDNNCMPGPNDDDIMQCLVPAALDEMLTALTAG